MSDAYVYIPPADHGLDIIHQDADILVLSKPAGLLSVRGRNPTPENQLGEALDARVQREFPDARIVHRLDMDTSGLMVMGLSADSHRHLSIQFEKRKTEKAYVALVWGMPDNDSGRVDLPVRCDWERRPRQIVDHEQGKAAQTDWTVMERGTPKGVDTSRVVLHPITGRTHQLRVHMAEIGHPILGDDFYAHEDAYKAAERLCLHAQDLSLYHPSSNEFMHFHSPCPF
ncbi:MAG: RluA family pseudouridine synthase [Alphaproteobacteria bacterium]|nr:RluA family pseudouridine synthase [Alphaproteobacteria bacterium]